MSWVKYTDWYQNHRFKAKFYDLYDQKKGKCLDSGVFAKYKNFQLYLVQREVVIKTDEEINKIIKPQGENSVNFMQDLVEKKIVKNDREYTKFKIIKPNGEETEEFLYCGMLDKVILDDEFTNWVKEIIKEDKKKGIQYNTDIMLNDLENVRDELAKIYRKDDEVSKNFWKWFILQWLEFQADSGEDRDYNYEITPKQVNKLAEELKDNDEIAGYLETILIDYLKDYEKEV